MHLDQPNTKAKKEFEQTPENVQCNVTIDQLGCLKYLLNDITKLIQQMHS